MYTQEALKPSSFVDSSVQVIACTIVTVFASFENCSSNCAYKDNATLTEDELTMMDNMLKKKEVPADILKALERFRRRRRQRPPSSSAVYRYLGGETYCQKEETRGRCTHFRRRELAVYDQQRRLLQAKAQIIRDRLPTSNLVKMKEVGRRE